MILLNQRNSDYAFIAFLSRAHIAKALSLLIFLIFLVFQSDPDCLLLFPVIASHKYRGQFCRFML